MSQRLNTDYLLVLTFGSVYIGVSSHNTCDNLASGGDELMIFMVTVL